MKKVSKALPQHILDELAALNAMRDGDIDLSDMPERQSFAGGERGRFYRPVKQQVTLRLDADILHWFKGAAKGGRGYQTRINAALRRFVKDEERGAG